VNRPPAAVAANKVRRVTSSIIFTPQGSGASQISPDLLLPWSAGTHDFRQRPRVDIDPCWFGLR
jgi:hypothetical protein